MKDHAVSLALGRTSYGEAVSEVGEKRELGFILVFFLICFREENVLLWWRCLLVWSLWFRCGSDVLLRLVFDVRIFAPLIQASVIGGTNDSHSVTNRKQDL